MELFLELPSQNMGDLRKLSADESVILLKAMKNAIQGMYENEYELGVRKGGELCVGFFCCLFCQKKEI